MRASRASIRRGILLNVIDDEDGHRDFVSLLELEPELFLQSIVEGQAAQRRVGGVEALPVMSQRSEFSHFGWLTIFPGSMSKER